MLKALLKSMKVFLVEDPEIEYLLCGDSSFSEVDTKGNDQEPIQSNSTPCPKHQMGKGHVQLRRH